MDEEGTSLPTSSHIDHPTCLALRLGNDDDRLVAQSVAHQRQANARVSRRALHYDSPGAEHTARFSLLRRRQADEQVMDVMDVSGFLEESEKRDKKR